MAFSFGNANTGYEHHAIEIPEDTICRCKCGFEGKYEYVQKHITEHFNRALSEFFAPVSER